MKTTDRIDGEVDGGLMGGVLLLGYLHGMISVL